MLLARQLQRIIKVGTLVLIDSKGRRHQFGAAADGIQPVTIKLHSRAAGRQLVLHPQLALGELYMTGELTFEHGSIRDLLDLLTCNIGQKGSAAQSALWRVADRLARLDRRFQQYNPIARARRNVHHHYDLSGRLYDTFLDADRQYSCAYFANGDETLEEAQEKKLRHIAAKLRLDPDMNVLDIGSGWGGLALYLARETGANVKGITLSTEQLDLSRARARDAGLASRVGFELDDYRQIDGTFDRIVSVGMFEHVGVNFYGTFFAQIRRLLADDGIALIHSIGRSTPPTATNPWIRKYIFPGGYIPALSEVLREVEKVGLWVTDVEILRLHYGRTLAQWRQRFLAHRREVAEVYDERFCRMWEFYLCAAELAFRNQDLMVFQLQLTKKVDSLPLTRDYMIDWERGQAIDSDATEGNYDHLRPQRAKHSRDHQQAAG